MGGGAGGQEAGMVIKVFGGWIGLGWILGSWRWIFLIPRSNVVMCVMLEAIFLAILP